MSETPRSLLETYLAAAEVKLTLAMNEVAAFTALLATVPAEPIPTPQAEEGLESGKGGKKKKEKKFDADGKEIKKAISAYTMFMKEHGSKADGINNYGFVGATEKWKELNDSEKMVYEQKADEFNLEDGRAVSKAGVKRAAETSSSSSTSSPSKKVATPSKVVGSSSNNNNNGNDSSSEEEMSVTETAKKRKKEKKEKKAKKDKKKRRESVGSEASSD